MKKSGVYIIHNLTNGKSYIGRTTDIVMRRSKHFSLLRKGKHPVQDLQIDFNNGCNFEFGVIDSNTYNESYYIGLCGDYNTFDKFLIFNSHCAYNLINYFISIKEYKTAKKHIMQWLNDDTLYKENSDIDFLQRQLSRWRR